MECSALVQRSVHFCLDVGSAPPSESWMLQYPTHTVLPLVQALEKDLFDKCSCGLLIWEPSHDYAEGFGPRS